MSATLKGFLNLRIEHTRKMMNQSGETRNELERNGRHTVKWEPTANNYKVHEIRFLGYMR